ncbi:hypothetical protein AB0L71_10795 [Streptomyces sp. NPDC052052]|uniref:hypothetical protein n=1 Tax=Streptomyces sp. NPDC052052 TaxID=3154756 RepID=UPI00342BD8A4
MLSATTMCRTISERPAEEYAPAAPMTDEVITVGHLATRSTHRDVHEYRALPAHLSLLRDALAGAGRTEGGPAAGYRRTPAHVARTTQLTLSQWVSRTASIGHQS